MDDHVLIERARLVEFIQSTLRAIVSFYLIGNYSGFLKETGKANPASKLFDLLPLVSVKEFMHQLSTKPELGPSAP